MDLSSFLGPERGAGLGRVWNTRLLPRRVAWFYLRALRLALASDDERAITSALPPPDLKRLLEIAHGHDRVVEVGTGAAWLAIALALDDPRRQVVSFDATPHPGRERYLELAGPRVGARVQLRGDPPDQVAGVVGSPAGLLIVSAVQQGAALAPAIEAARDALRTGGTGVLHPFPRTGVPATAVAELGLPGHHESERLYVWREPERPPPPPPPPAAAPPALARRRRVRLPSLPSLRRAPAARARRRWPRVAAVAAAVLLGGVAGALALYEIDSEELPDSVTTTAPPEAGTLPPPAAVPAPPDSRRPRARRRGQRRSSEGRRRRARREPSAPRRPRDRRIRAYSGRGTRRIGTVRVGSDSILRWRTSGGRFAISSTALQLDSRERTGRSDLSRGRYRRFTVDSPGRWRLTIRPR